MPIYKISLEVLPGKTQFFKQLVPGIIFEIIHKPINRSGSNLVHSSRYITMVLILHFERCGKMYNHLENSAKFVF